MLRTEVRERPHSHYLPSLAGAVGALPAHPISLCIITHVETNICVNNGESSAETKITKMMSRTRVQPYTAARNESPLFCTP